MKAHENSTGLDSCHATTREAVEKAETLDRNGEWDKAIVLYDKTFLKAGEIGDEWAQAHVMRKVGEIQRRRGESLAALRMFHSSRGIFRRLGDSTSLSYLYNNIGLVFFGHGKWRLVRRYFGRAMKIARAQGDRKLQGQIFNNLGIMYQITGENRQAIRYFERVLPSYRELGYSKGEGQVYNNIGMCYRDSGDWAKALDYYTEGLKRIEGIGDKNLLGITVLNIAMVLIHQGEGKRAKEYCDQAFALFKELNDELGIAESYLCYGLLCRKSRKLKEAEQYFQKSISLNTKLKNNLGLAESYRELALLYQDKGKSKLVLRFLGESFKVFQEIQASLYVNDIDEKMRELEEIYFRIAKVMGEEVESKDTYTYGHCKRVAHYSVMLGEEIGLTEKEKKAILVAAFLHDLGKVKIPKEILVKPRKLSPDEYLTIMNHPAWGVELLDSVEFPWEVKTLIMHHQERFDGKGYPDGLEGESIPLNARVISIADFFDALTTERPYRGAMSLDGAFSIMRREQGKVLDPELLCAFETLIRKQFPSGKTVMGEMEFEDLVAAWKKTGISGATSLTRNILTDRGRKTRPVTRQATEAVG